MKRIYILIVLAFVTFAVAPPNADAQYSYRSLTISTASTVTLDTVSTTSATYLYTGRILGGTSTLCIWTKAVENAASTTGGTAVLEASMDGVTFYPVGSGGYRDTIYTFTLTDVTTQSYRWYLPHPADMYYRVKYVATGSPNFQISGKVVGKVD